MGPPAAGGLRPCPLPSPNAFPSRCFRSLSPCAHSNPRSYQAPFSSSPAGRKTSPKSKNIRPSPAPPRPLRGRQTGRSPFRLRRKPRASLVGPPAAGGLRPCPLPSPNAFPSRCFFSLSCPPATSPPNAPNPKDSPAAFHRLRGSVHLWYFVPALMAQARYSCSHSNTRAS